MSLLTHALAVPTPVDVLDAMNVFWDAHNRAEALRENLTRAQLAGVDPLPLALDYWDGEARARFEAVLDLVGIDPDDDVFGSLDGLYDRPRVTHVGPTGMSDWGKSRSAA